MAEVRWSSEITEVERDHLVTYGVDQREIIRSFSYEEMVFLMLCGRRPEADEATMLRAVIVAHASHGITGQSTIAARAAADCGSDFLHALIGGLSVGAGPHHLGSLRAAMEELEELAGAADDEVERYVDEILADDGRIVGFGHRFHSHDPRAAALVELAQELGRVGPCLTAALTIDRILDEKRGLRMNIEAAIAAILVDLGIDSRIGHLIIVLGRSPMLAAAYLERLAEDRDPFQRIAVYDVVDEAAKP